MTSPDVVWKTALSPTRLGCPTTAPQTEARTDFVRDYDRLIFSSPFRRLQGKTQVFPMPESDMTHNRLTHSLEVACVARSLGTIAARRLELESFGIPAADVGAVVAAAALAHDIGNPPFGHSGEAAIGAFFTSGAGSAIIANLGALQRHELQSFEGNALGFRILTRSKVAQTAVLGGLGLTQATLATFSKYPCLAESMGSSAGVHHKKFGAFHDSRSDLDSVMSATGSRQIHGGSG